MGYACVRMKTDLACLRVRPDAMANRLFGGGSHFPYDDMNACSRLRSDRFATAYEGSEIDYTVRPPSPISPIARAMNENASCTGAR